MDIGIIARRYAVALADCASQRGEEDRAYDEACALIDAMRGNQAVRQALASPILRPSAKLEMFRRLLPEPVCGTLDDFMELVLRHHRESFLDFMLESFRRVCKQRRNIREAVLTTAAPADDAFVERVAGFARGMAGGEVQISREVRPELVGGFVFRLDDLMIDASISTQIARLQRAFSQTTNRIV